MDKKRIAIGIVLFCAADLFLAPIFLTTYGKPSTIIDFALYSNIFCRNIGPIFVKYGVS